MIKFIRNFFKEQKDKAIIGLLAESVQLRKEYRYKDAIILLIDAFELDNHNLDVLKELSITYFEDDDYKNALKYIDMLLIKEPSNKEAILIKAKVLTKDKLFECAYNVLTDNIKLGTEIKEARMELLSLVTGIPIESNYLYAYRCTMYIPKQNLDDIEYKLDKGKIIFKQVLAYKIL